MLLTWTWHWYPLLIKPYLATGMRVDSYNTALWWRRTRPGTSKSQVIMMKACAFADCAHPSSIQTASTVSARLSKFLPKLTAQFFPWHWFRRALCKFTCCIIGPCSFTPVPRVLAWYSWSWYQSCNLTGYQTFFSWTFALTFNIIQHETRHRQWRAVIAMERSVCLHLPWQRSRGLYNRDRESVYGWYTIHSTW